MNPQVALALLAKFTNLSKEAAEKISIQLSLATQPATYKDAEHLIDKLVSEAKSSNSSSAKV